MFIYRLESEVAGLFFCSPASEAPILLEEDGKKKNPGSFKICRARVKRFVMSVFLRRIHSLDIYLNLLKLMLYFIHYFNSSFKFTADEMMAKVQHQFREVHMDCKAGERNYIIYIRISVNLASNPGRHVISRLFQWTTIINQTAKTTTLVRVINSSLCYMKEDRTSTSTP